jgi:hypothetical protein
MAQYLGNGLGTKGENKWDKVSNCMHKPDAEGQTCELHLGVAVLDELQHIRPPSQTRSEYRQLRNAHYLLLLNAWNVTSFAHFEGP